DLEKDPLSDKETKTLNKLYAQAGDIKNELREVEHLTLKNNLRWMDVQLALATQEEPADNTIIDGFETVEKKVEGFSEANQDSPLNGNETKEHKFKFLTGNKISEEEALENSKKLFNVTNDNDLTIAKSGKGADVPM